MRNRRHLRTLGLWLMPSLFVPPLMAAPAPAGQAALKPFTADYKMVKGFITVAQGEYQLQPTGKNCYLYSGHAEASGVVSLFRGDKIEEESRFCVVDGAIRPQFYRFYHKGGKKDHNYTLTFDWKNRTVAIKRQDKAKPTTRKIPADAQDDLSMQVALRRRLLAADGKPGAPLQIHLVTRNHIRTYNFKLQGRSELDTAAGHYKTLELAREHPGDEQVRFWVAPKLDYLPVKIERSGPGLKLEMTQLPQSPVTGTASADTRKTQPPAGSEEIHRHRRGAGF